MLLPVSTDTKVTIPFFDKVIHALIYLVFVFLWLLYFKKTNKQVKGIYILVSVALFIYGIVIEVLQGSLIVTRTYDNWDIVANATGIILGTIVFYKLKDTFLFKK